MTVTALGGKALPSALQGDLQETGAPRLVGRVIEGEVLVPLVVSGPVRGRHAAVPASAPPGCSSALS
jgi:hypothetical protein